MEVLFNQKLELDNLLSFRGKVRKNEKMILLKICILLSLEIKDRISYYSYL